MDKQSKIANERERGLAKWSSTTKIGLLLQLLIVLVLWFGPFGLHGQSFENRDFLYEETIRSVQFTIPGLQTAYPIISLESGRLDLHFDEIGNDARYLRYKIEHCTKDWEPSELEELEYIQGFNGEELRDYAFSVNTRIPYIHYRLSIPNRDLRWTKSGNYLLHVYDEDTNEPLLTQRFMVVENVMKVFGDLSKTADVGLIRTHHEIDFVVKHKDIQISNPHQEITATILQNGRWDNAIMNIPPFFIQKEELIFNYQGKIVFPAGKEFRNVDFRSLEYTSRNIAEIDEYDDAFEVKMMRDEKRTYHNYHTDKDFNGQFAIQSHDDPDFDVEGEYAYVLFSLNSVQPLYDQEVYLVGGFSDWQLAPAYKMEYSERYQTYMQEVLLKQGVYDYAYAVIGENGGLDMSPLEGDWHETENYYTILIYYRPFGERYDRLVAVTTLGEK
ncbi:MAG: DUF5103 domain-containing protein [Saprospiraceae bacterium]|nr:DUF5103 domain-containing protein [Saprospiraceae bacterium]